MFCFFFSRVVFLKKLNSCLQHLRNIFYLNCRTKCTIFGTINEKIFLNCGSGFISSRSEVMCNILEKFYTSNGKTKCTHFCTINEKMFLTCASLSECVFVKLTKSILLLATALQNVSPFVTRTRVRFSLDFGYCKVSKKV